MKAPRLLGYVLADVGRLVLAAGGVVVYVETIFIAYDESFVFDPVAALLLLGVGVVLAVMGVALLRDARRVRDKG